MFEMYEFEHYERRLCKDYIHYINQEFHKRKLTEEEIEDAIKQDTLLIEALREKLNKDNVDILNSLLVRYDHIKRSQEWQELRESHDKLVAFSAIKHICEQALKYKKIERGNEVIEEIDELVDRKIIRKYEKNIENNIHYEFYLEYFDTMDKYHEDARMLCLIRKTMLEVEKLQILCKEHPELIKTTRSIFKRK